MEKEYRKEAKAVEETDEEQEAPVRLMTYVINKLHSILSNVNVYINNQLTYSSNVLYAHKSCISNNFRRTTFDYKGVMHW